jgi:hypothetical protein
MKLQEIRRLKLVNVNNNKYMNTQNTLLSIALIALGVGVAFTGFKSVEVAISTPEQPNLGAVTSSNFLDTPVFNAGVSGVQVPMTATSTTLCKAQNPTMATSTFTAAFRITTATTSATVIGLATTTNALRDQATSTASTAIGTSKTVGANVSGVSSYRGINEQNILGPNEWVMYNYQTGTSPAGGMTSNAQAGFCNFMFNAI